MTTPTRYICTRCGLRFDSTESRHMVYICREADESITVDMCPRCDGDVLDAAIACDRCQGAPSVAGTDLCEECTRIMEGHREEVESHG